MKSKYFTPELARFLFDKGLLTIAERRHEHFKRIDKCNFTYPIKTLISSFEWEATAERASFWGKLNDEFYNK